MQRILSFLIALGLASLGPLPVSACALMYSQVSECATPQTETRCEQMGMDQAEGPSASASSKTCCVLSKAPLPDAQTRAGDLSIAKAPATVSNIILATPAGERTLSLDPRLDSSPPPRQPLLCTFLI
jgi:hypothetical protein